MEAYKDAILGLRRLLSRRRIVQHGGASPIVFWYGGLRSLAGVVAVGVLITFMQYAQRFFRPIQDLSEKFNILQSAMAASERIFKLLDEPSACARPRSSAASSRAARRNRISQRVVRLPRRRKPEGRRLGPARRFLPRRAGADPRHRRPHRRRQDHAHPAAAALLRNPARPDSARRRGHPRVRRAPDLRRQFGIVLQDPFLFTGTLGIERPPGRRRHQPRRASSPRCAKWGSAPSSIPCRKASKHTSASAARLFPSASANLSASRARWRTIRAS